MRLRRTLSSGWDFVPDRDAAAVVDAVGPRPPDDGWRPVRVPGFWQVQFPELTRATGPAWYRVQFELDETWFQAGDIILEFGAVGHFCQGWVNGRPVGHHEGGHLPFEWLLTGIVQPGANELLVRVVSPSGDRSRYPDFPFEEILHGKQSWYGPAGGIWQDVTVVARAPVAVNRLDIRPNPQTSSAEVGVELTAKSSTVRIDVTIFDADDQIVAAETGVTPGVATTVDLGGHELDLWSPDSPTLYRVRAEVFDGDRRIDATDKRFGFRTFTASEGRFVLNGEPILLQGLLDQDYYDSPGVPSSKAAIIERFNAVKAMGFNLLRCHIKLPDPRYLDAADEVGLLLWCELPTTSRLTVRAQQRVEETLIGMVDRDRHHPSIVIWGIANEAWGFDLLGNSEHRRWLQELYHRMKSDVADRLIVDNSPCTPNFHVETDIEDYHFYAVIPEMRERWDRFLDGFTARADFTYSPFGDARRSGSEPLVVSEFGAWGLADLSDLEVDEPWWFETGQEWADGAAYVHGARERYSLWHLDRVFGSWEGLCLETQRRQFDTMVYQIQTMRLRPEIAGYVLTELGDVYWESNGLFDMAGRPRSFVGRLAELNGSPTLIMQNGQQSLWDGQSTTIETTFINSHRPRQSAVLQCRVGQGDISVQEVGSIEAGGHRLSRSFEITARCGADPLVTTIDCALVDGDGRVASSKQPLLVLPRVAAPSDSKPLLVGDDDLARLLIEMGYQTSDRASKTGLRVMSRLDTDDHDFIEAGGRGLLLASDTSALGKAFGEFPPIQLKRWADALHGGGEWVSAFSWLRRSGRFAHLPGGPLMDSAFEGLRPEVVITGIPPARFEYDVLAGVFVGWVHQVAALIARHNAGLGSLVISTLNLTEAAKGDDPLANWMLHQLIATALEQP